MAAHRRRSKFPGERLGERSAVLPVLGLETGLRKLQSISVSRQFDRRNVHTSQSKHDLSIPRTRHPQPLGPPATVDYSTYSPGLVLDQVVFRAAAEGFPIPLNDINRIGNLGAF